MSMALRRSTTTFLTNLRLARFPPRSWSATRSFTTESLLGDAEDAVLEPPLLTGVRRGWLGKEDDEFLYFRMDMPGLAQQHVRVNIEKNNNDNTLVIEAEKEDNEMGFTESKGDANDIVGRRKYTARIDIPPNSCITNQLIKQVNNGALKVKIPKVAGAGNNLVEFTVPNTNENLSSWMELGKASMPRKSR